MIINIKKDFFHVALIAGNAKLWHDRIHCNLVTLKKMSENNLVKLFIDLKRE